VCLTIAGSDSGGGAGVQADLKTFAALGVFGTSAVTCLTAQNPDGVTGIHAAPAAMVARQIRTVLEGFPVAAAKTGMLYAAATIRAVARAWRPAAPCPLVVDPVMVATSGARLLRDDALATLCRELLPLAAVVTPNLPEAEILAGRPIRSLGDLMAAARAIGERYGTACVVKGAHLPGPQVFDALWHGGRVRVFASARVPARETHGTGCTFSAAVAAWLARGHLLPRAVAEAGRFVAGALRGARRVGRHYPLRIPPPA
jgi:hydroxymethylpyrimidine/phosphomethylpyrimidine kinase